MISNNFNINKIKNILFILLVGSGTNLFTQVNLVGFDATTSLSDTNFTSVAHYINNPPQSESVPPDIIHVIHSPTCNSGDIAFDGVNLWVASAFDHKLYKISPANGNIIKTISTSIIVAYGLEFESGHLWVADTYDKNILKVDTSNGDIISSFPSPCKSRFSYPEGLAWDGHNLWYNDGVNINTNDSTYEINKSGEIVQSHKAFGTAVSGLAWDGHYLWSSDNIKAMIYKIDIPSFTAVDSINAPGGIYPNGLASDGHYLWVANNDADSIYQIDISHRQPSISDSNLTKSSGFLIYPNPTNDEITVQYSIDNDNVNSSYSVRDYEGREVLNGKLTHATTMIDMNQLSAGIYLLRIGKIKMQSYKIIKIK